MKNFSIILSVVACGFVCALAVEPALGAPPPIPGPADVGRIQLEGKIPVIDHSADGRIVIPEAGPTTGAPADAEKIHFVLKKVDIKGSTVFTEAELESIYAPYIGKDVTLDIAWKLAAEVTKRYRDNGYFLSRAYVPGQSVKDGTITIKVIEGYVGEVELKDDVGSYSVVQSYIQSLKAKHPLKSSEMESFLLRMNDLPGLSFRAVLSSADNKDDANNGSAKLTLVPSDNKDKGTISFDNYGSRYLGPNEVTASYSADFLPLQQTTLTALTSTPTHELKYGMIDHLVPLAVNTTLELNGGITKAYPGYKLKKEDIDSKSASLGVSLNYQLIRQREENLGFRMTFDERNTDSDILSTPETRDKVRAVRVGTSFDISDAWLGYNNGSLIISRGLDVLGSSEKGDPFLSREQATPDFTKAEFSLSRLQGITSDWFLLASASGQWASGTLFSSEEYGYGGTAFGRAYDASEITGDDGLAGSLELRFNGLGEMQPVHFMPYVFYDIGKVWNDDITQPKSLSGSSAGFGFRFATDFELSGNLGLAFPLTLPVATPAYGYGNHHNPRILLQLSQGF